MSLAFVSEIINNYYIKSDINYWHLYVEDVSSTSYMYNYCLRTCECISFTVVLSFTCWDHGGQTTEPLDPNQLQGK